MSAVGLVYSGGGVFSGEGATAVVVATAAVFWGEAPSMLGPDLELGDVLGISFLWCHDKTRSVQCLVVTPSHEDPECGKRGYQDDNDRDDDADNQGCAWSRRGLVRGSGGCMSGGVRGGRG